MNDYLLYLLLFGLSIATIYIVSFTISWWKNSNQKDNIDNYQVYQEKSLI